MRIQQNYMHFTKFWTTFQSIIYGQTVTNPKLF